MEGPERVIAADNLWSTKPDGCVKIRQSDGNSKDDIKPMSLVTFITQQVCQFFHQKIRNLFFEIRYGTKMSIFPPTLANLQILDSNRTKQVDC